MAKARLWTTDYVTITTVNFFTALNFYLLMIAISSYAIERFEASGCIFCCMGAPQPITGPTDWPITIRRIKRSLPEDGGAEKLRLSHQPTRPEPEGQSRCQVFGHGARSGARGFEPHVVPEYVSEALPSSLECAQRNHMHP